MGDRDTLTSVAAHFDTTPSELTQLNRLGSSFIYPGQQLQVPDKSKKVDTDDTTSEASSESADNNRKVSTDELPVDERGEIPFSLFFFLKFVEFVTEIKFVEVFSGSSRDLRKFRTVDYTWL